MVVIKRDCSEVEFNKDKIEQAILKAMKNGNGTVKENIAKNIANEIYEENKDNDEISIYEIEDAVFNKLINKKQRLTAKAYEGYRQIREYQREITNSTDKSINELLEGTNDYWNTENSNKDAKVVSTQRDYLAGITSEDISKRFLLTPEIVHAHEEGIIHFHDIDYFAQRTLHNCDLINLEDMLQNGTVINGVLIEKPHKLLTAMTIATQIITAVASSQYGGVTITLTHLAPFVRDSYLYYVEKYKNRGFDYNSCVKFAKEDLKKEVKDGVQTFNYQINSMTTTNGQAPFLSVFMYLNETTEYREELAMLIEEFLNQRMMGFKNEKGVYVTPAFPKLLYMLEDDNIKEDSKYWYLTELAANVRQRDLFLITCLKKL
jgi:ribonucleoside-triphosphate reductase